MLYAYLHQLAFHTDEPLGHEIPTRGASTPLEALAIIDHYFHDGQVLV